MPPDHEYDDVSGGAFTPDERKRIRRLIRADDRARWFWSTVRIWVLWLGGVAVALAATKAWIVDVLKGLLGLPK